MNGPMSNTLKRSVISDNVIPESGVYFGTVYHKRHAPFEHDFRYRVFTFWLELDKLPELDAQLKRFSFNKSNLFSIHERDHGKRDGSSVREWIEKAGKRRGLNLKECRIFMLGFPRMWNYAFNPLTVYYCFAPDGTLRAVLHQVKNTFGDQHGYLIPVDDVSKGGKVKQSAEKIFHVSPFFEMDCRYEFRFAVPSETLDFAIHQFGHEGKLLTATWNGEYEALTDKVLIKALRRNTFMTFKVIAGIHWEALKLWLKGAKYIPRTAPPKEDVT
tara:strand:- start:1473 stop:2288 length:816 start_codon:yes stop_codon:yes gene_type:complete